MLTGVKLRIVLQAKNEPAGKKPAEKSDAKKSGSDRRHSSDSKPEKYVLCPCFCFVLCLVYVFISLLMIDLVPSDLKD